MINRIRDIRKRKGWTLADLAEACDPPTTPQTIGRLETGTRALSTAWMERIAAALKVDVQALIRADDADIPQIVAQLASDGPRALAKPAEAILPTDLAATPLMALTVVESCGEYRPGDQLWLRKLEDDETASAINRDVLVPRPGGRFAFGRLIDRRGSFVGILPPHSGAKQQVVDNPPWVAVAQMLVREL